MRSRRARRLGRCALVVALLALPCAAGPAALAAQTAPAAQVAPASTGSPTGLSPGDMQDAYNLQSATEGSLQTVAVVTPYDDPDAESDMSAYRTEYGLLPCTTADGCFQKVNQTGGSSYPSEVSSWSTLVAQSLDAVSAICPNCHILLVEADSAEISDLGTAENEAVSLGARFVDNDWGILESTLGSAETTYDTDYFNHPGVAITAPAGNGGYGVIEYPAASQYVIAVGGTVLSTDTSSVTGYSEAAWPETGSGCSVYEPKPTWQTDTGCANRVLNDVSAVATDVSYYDTPTVGGWANSSGTVISAAIVAAVYALAGVPAAGTYPASYPYEHPGGSYTTPGNAYTSVDGLNNITTESGGTVACSPTYLCNPGAGYNGPTGLGSPNTDLSFASSGESGVFYSGVMTMCMDDDRASTAVDTVTQVYQCNGGVSQDWTIEPDGTVRFDSDYCLYVNNAGESEGDVVELNDCETTDGGMLWIPLANDTLYNPRSSMCLYDPDGTVNSTQLEIYACNHSSRTQQWPIPQTAPTATGTISSQAVSGICADDYHSGTTDGTIIDADGCNGTNAQNWTVEPGGTLQVLNGCMTTDNSDVEWDTCAGTEYQYWIPRSDGSLYTPADDLCLEDPGASDSGGTQLEITPCYTAAEISASAAGYFDTLWNIP